jgi:hypothetical protein
MHRVFPRTLEAALILALILATVSLGVFLIRDFRRGVIHTTWGTYRRIEQPGPFWFWTANHFVLLVFVLCVAVGTLLRFALS